MGVGHMGGGPFVADINDANAGAGDPVPDGHDMATAKSENAVDAACDKEFSDKAGDRFRCLCILSHYAISPCR